MKTREQIEDALRRLVHGGALNVNKIRDVADEMMTLQRGVHQALRERALRLVRARQYVVLSDVLDELFDEEQGR